MKKTYLRKRWDAKGWGLSHLGIDMTSKKRTTAFDAEAAKYCSQSTQECLLCSLSSYGLDCHNNSVHIDKPLAYTVANNPNCAD